MTETTTNPIQSTQRWLERAVIGLNLCPFAKTVHVRGKIRYVLSQAIDDNGVMVELIDELKYLASVSADEVDTTLIVIPHLFTEFDDFNDFVGVAEDEVWVQGLEGVLQVAHFHPQFQFADTAMDDPQNNTNRAPYPTLHLLREASLDAAVDAMPDTAEIYERNIEVMTKLGNEGFTQLLTKP